MRDRFRAQCIPYLGYPEPARVGIERGEAAVDAQEVTDQQRRGRTVAVARRV